MTESDPPKVMQKPDAPIKARDGLTPMAVAKLAQARIKTLADIKRLTDDELRRLPLGIMEYNAIKKYAASLSFDGDAAGPEGAPGDAPSASS